MGRRKHSKRARQANGLRNAHLLEERQRELETIHLINTVLDAPDVDTGQLRKIAAVRGLVNNERRSKAWPILLGVDNTQLAGEDYQRLSSGKHRDSSTVECDVARSLWAFTEGWPDEARATQRAALQRLLTAVVCAHQPHVHYYQGLHDVASVLLLCVGEARAYPLLARLCVTHLRDCTRPDLDAVLCLLGLLMPILQKCDPELHAYIDASGVPPYFALSWFITWFAHNEPSLAQLARLFDFFMASHPLMPLYAAAVVMRASRDTVLACEQDPAELHRALNNLPILAVISTDDLAHQATHLFRSRQPQALLGLPRQLSPSTSRAMIKHGHWWVPDEPYIPPTPARGRPWGVGHSHSRRTWQPPHLAYLQLLLSGRGKPPPLARVTALASLVSLGALTVAAMMYSQSHRIGLGFQGGLWL